MSGEEPGGGGQRIDRWLWFARIFKSRSLASRAVAEDGVRVTRAGETQRVAKPAFALRIRDIVTLKRKDELRVLEVVALGVRRGPSSEALGLYNDLGPPPAETAKSPASPRPAGRPSKRDRREIARLKGQGE